jgi:hypothetical protein
MLPWWVDIRLCNVAFLGRRRAARWGARSARRGRWDSSASSQRLVCRNQPDKPLQILLAAYFQTKQESARQYAVFSVALVRSLCPCSSMCRPIGWRHFMHANSEEAPVHWPARITRVLHWPAEIFEQVILFDNELRAEQRRLSNVVFMGMGEPLANFRYMVYRLFVLKDRARVASYPGCPEP